MPDLLPRGGSKATLRVSPAVDSVALPEEPKIRFTSDFVFADSPVVAGLDASLEASLEIKIDRQRAASPGEAFAVRFDSVQASAAASSALDFAARVGLLGVSATGSAELDAGLAATVAGGQAIAAGRLRERSMSEFVTTSSTGRFGSRLRRRRAGKRRVLRVRGG